MDALRSLEKLKKSLTKKLDESFNGYVFLTPAFPPCPIDDFSLQALRGDLDDVRSRTLALDEATRLGQSCLADVASLRLEVNDAIRG